MRGSEGPAYGFEGGPFRQFPGSGWCWNHPAWEWPERLLAQRCSSTGGMTWIQGHSADHAPHPGEEAIRSFRGPGTWHTAASWAPRHLDGWGNVCCEGPAGDCVVHADRSAVAWARNLHIVRESDEQYVEFHLRRSDDVLCGSGSERRVLSEPFTVPPTWDHRRRAGPGLAMRARGRRRGCVHGSDASREPPRRFPW